MTVIKSRHQAESSREKHAIAEHVAAHVSDAGDRERIALYVDTDLTEEMAHALPLPTWAGERGSRSRSVGEPSQ